MTDLSIKRKTADTTQSFREWAHAKPLFEALARAEAALRTRSQAPVARRLLFKLLWVPDTGDISLLDLRHEKFDGEPIDLKGGVNGTA